MNFKISKSNAILMLLLFPIFRPEIVRHFFSINFIYQLLLLYSLINCVLVYIKRKKKPSSFVWIIIGLQAWLYIITYINNADVTAVERTTRVVLCLAFIIDLYQNQFKQIIISLNRYFSIFICVNLVLMLVFPSGIYHSYSFAYNSQTVEWFFGVGNTAALWHFPAVFIAWLYAETFNRSSYGWFITGVVILSQLIDGSATCIVGVVILVLIIKINKVKAIITPKIGLIGVVILFTSLVVLQSFDFLRPFIENVLGKSMTFTGRVNIWSNSIALFLENPITGSGVMYISDLANILGKMPGTDYIWLGAAHCHDNYLQILVSGGIIAFLFYLIIYIVVIKKAKLYWKDSRAKICVAALIAFSVMQITEVYDQYVLMYLIFLIPYNIDKICMNNSKICYKYIERGE